MNIKFLGLLFILIFGCLSGHAKSYKVFTTESLVQDSGKLPVEVASFLSPTGPLNKLNGVIGALGTLGAYSPFGNSPINATPYMRSLGNWEDTQRTLTRLGGPLGENGPYIFATELGQSWLDMWGDFFPGSPASNLFKSLRAGSPLHILGDAGPLGALSMMGPGGPNGATGFAQTEDGRFINESGNVVHSIDIDTVDGKWEAPLYELYSDADGKKIQSADAFFALATSVKRSNPKKTVSFHNNREQWISVLLIGDYTLDDYELVLRAKGSEEVIATTSQDLLSNFIVFQAPKDTAFEVDVRLKYSGHILPKKKFRLLVTGSSEKAKSFKGPHQRTYSDSLLRYTKSAIKGAFKNSSCTQLIAPLLKAQ